MMENFDNRIDIYEIVLTNHSYYRHLDKEEINSKFNDLIEFVFQSYSTTLSDFIASVVENESDCTAAINEMLVELRNGITENTISILSSDPTQGPEVHIEANELTFKSIMDLITSKYFLPNLAAIIAQGNSGDQLKSNLAMINRHEYNYGFSNIGIPSFEIFLKRTKSFLQEQLLLITEPKNESDKEFKNFNELVKNKNDISFIEESLEKLGVTDSDGNFILSQKKRSGLLGVVRALKEKQLIHDATEEELMKAFTDKVKTTYTRLKPDSNIYDELYRKTKSLIIDRNK